MIKNQIIWNYFKISEYRYNKDKLNKPFSNVNAISNILKFGVDRLI